MAASRLLIDDIVNELNCTVCLEKKRLHLFPCSHRCCQECIGSLAGGYGRFPCPVCRREVVVPHEGFPVCLLSEYLREKINISLNHTQGSSSKCTSCNVKPVEARCTRCHTFICYRCDKRGTCKSNESSGHESSDLEDEAVIANYRLQSWKASTEREIPKLKEVIRQKQREIQDHNITLQSKEISLQACENIENQSDCFEKITAIEQICGEDRGSLLQHYRLTMQDGRPYFPVRGNWREERKRFIEQVYRWHLKLGYKN